MATFARSLTLSFFAAGLLWLSDSATAEATYTSDYTHVTVEKRHGRDWCVLDAQVTAVIPLRAAALFAVIQDFSRYPEWFKHITEATATPTDDGVSLTESVVVEALGLRNVNRFGLKMRTSESWNPHTLTQTWTQEWSDGTIDDVWGSWVLVDQGTPDRPETRVVYHSHSAVPQTIFGQFAFIQLFLGGETRDVVKAVAKAAGAR